MTAGSDVKCFLFFSWGEERGEEGRVWGVRWRHGIRPLRLNSLNWSIKCFTKSLLRSFSLDFKTCVSVGLCNLTWSGLFCVRVCDLIQFNVEKKNWKGSGWWNWAQCSVDGAVEPLSTKADDTRAFILGFCSAVWIIHELRRRSPHLTPVRLTLKLFTARDKVSRDGEPLGTAKAARSPLCVSSSELPRGKKAKLQKRRISFEEKERMLLLQLHSLKVNKSCVKDKRFADWVSAACRYDNFTH